MRTNKNILCWHPEFIERFTKTPLKSNDETLVEKIANFLPFDLEPGRQLTLAHFNDTLTGKNFAIINTHLTYYRINSREDQALFIEQLILSLKALNKPIILSGDFNAFPNRPDRTKLTYYDGDYICQIFLGQLDDTKDVAVLGHVGPTSTGLTDFFSRGNSPFKRCEDSDVILDHILCITRGSDHSKCHRI